MVISLQGEDWAGTNVIYDDRIDRRIGIKGFIEQSSQDVPSAGINPEGGRDSIM